MGYAVKQDLIDRYGEDEMIQLTDRNRLGVIDDGVLDSALADAADEVTPYLAARYAVPLASVPAVLVRITCQIARYRLYDDVAPDRIQKDYDGAIAFLKDVSRGVVTLGLDNAGAAATVSNGADISSGGRIFSRDDNGLI